MRAAKQRERVWDLPLSLLSMVTRGRVYDLSSGWWPGMPLAEGHPPFQVLTYRTPQGQRVQQDMAFLDENSVGFGFISELISMTAHTGTHVDALSHIVAGADQAWHGGRQAADFLGDFGPIVDDVASMAPFLCRGVLLDVPAALGADRLQAHQPVGRVELVEAARLRGVDLRTGDVVLLRTGTMRAWPDREALAKSEGAGLSLDGATWLLERGPAAIGADNAAVEVAPSGLEGDPQPVHRVVIAERGVPLMEWVYLEDLAADEIGEFLFVCLPLPIQGATGSPVRPLAIV